MVESDEHEASSASSVLTQNRFSISIIAELHTKG
jgi:hypothetical protein